MKNLLTYITVLTLIFIFAVNNAYAESIEISDPKKLFSAEELNILSLLENYENELKLNDQNVFVSNKDGDQSSKTVDKNAEKIKVNHLKTYLEEKPSLIQIQVFDLETNEQIFVQTVESLKELNELKFETPKYILDTNKDEPVFQADYMAVISTNNHVGFYDFTRFYVNDIDAADPELLKGILQYMKATDLHNGLDIEFVKRSEPIKDLDLTTSENSTSCIACVGPIYQVKSNVYYNKWVNVAEIHAIKGVDNTFTLSKGKSSTITVESKSVTPVGTISSSGSVSSTATTKYVWPKRSGSTISSPGTYAQQEFQFVKTEYENAKNKSDVYTSVRRNKWIGGTNISGSVGGNGKSFSTVTGEQIVAGSKVVYTQQSAHSYSNQGQTTAYGHTVGLKATLNTSSQNEWSLETKTGMGYSTYKAYGNQYNLTAK